MTSIYDLRTIVFVTNDTSHANPEEQVVTSESDINDILFEKSKKIMRLLKFPLIIIDIRTIII